MPAISCEDFVPWVNYHLSVGQTKGKDLEPQLQVERLARVHASDLEGAGLERFARTAEMLSGHLKVVRTLMRYKLELNQLGSPPQPFPLAMTGRGWSFADVVGARAGEPCPAMLVLDGLSGAVRLEPNHKETQFQQTDVALASGGMRLRELAERADRWGLSILNSGTHLGTTIAGAIATASHGSRRGEGGLQNRVHGLHLVTGIGEAVWIERESRPVLTKAAARQLFPEGWTNTIIRCDATFEDALVHMGCLGIVNAVAVELAPASWIERCHRAHPIDRDWLCKLAKGDWTGVADAFRKERQQPLFYELTVDPHAWDQEPAVHIAYFAAGQPFASLARPYPTLADAVASAGLLGLQGMDAADRPFPPAGFLERRVPMKDFFPSATEESIFAFYKRQVFAQGNGGTGRWKDLHPDEITGGYPGALWNASWAIPREKLADAIPAITDAVRDLPRSFVFTVRFVSDAAGTLAFTRFRETAVIDIDGLSPWICRKVAQRWINYKGGKTEGIEATLELLDAIGPALPEGGRRVSEALNRAGVDFSMHWAKLGAISPAAVHTAFGDPAEPKSPLGRWRATRERLLATEFARAIFWNWGAVRMGLLDRPDQLPSDLQDAAKNSS